MKTTEKISVLMSVYKNDKAEWVALSLDSILNQTYKADEIVLIKDGAIPGELDQLLKEYAEKHKQLKVYENETNIGLGLTMQRGVELCKNEIIARMDSDDIAVLDRFEKELAFMQENELDLVGSSVNEFIDNVENIVSKKMVPTGKDDIEKYAKTRNPFCHPTVMFKKSAIIKAGNYQDMKLCEDYYLWVRVIQSGAKVDNMSEPLVNMRVSPDLYARRGGYKYYKSQKQLLKYMKKTKFIGLFTYLKSCFIRFCVQVLMPNKLRQKFYMKNLRK